MVQFFRQLLFPQKIVVVLLLLLVIAFSGAAFLRFSPSADINPVSATLTITDSDGTRQQTIGNLYTMRLDPGDHIIESSIPDGRTVAYSPCQNCTNHLENSYTYGSRAKFSVPAGSYMSVVWYYPARDQYPSYHKVVDCSVPGSCDENGGHGAIAASITRKDGEYHTIYCSAPDNEGGRLGLQDYLRYTKSPDGKKWTQPKVVVKASPSLGENGLKADKSACDPSVVYFNGYYYVYYGNAYETGFGNNQTVISVARSGNIGGPYFKYTKRGTWEENPSDVAHIIKPLVFRGVPDEREGHFYGAGQPSVVVKDGKLMMWYLDDSVDTFQGSDGKDSGVTHVYMLEATNPVDWKPSVERRTNLGNQHADMKYDSTRQKFIAFREANSHSNNAAFNVHLSDDGLNWSPATNLIPNNLFPNYANNMGVSSDERGWLTPDEPIMISIATPYDLIAPEAWGETDREENWGNWDIFGILYNIRDALLTEEDKTAVTRPTASPSQAATDRSPIGWLDFINSDGVIYGWSLDPDVPTESIRVNFYLDKPYQANGKGGTFIGDTIANLPSPDVTSATSYPGNHRFTFQIPDKYLDGGQHPVYAYGINTTVIRAQSVVPAKDTLLDGSPKTATLPKSATVTPTSSPTSKSTPSPVPTTATPRTEVTPVSTPKPIPNANRSIACRLWGWFCPKPSPTPRVTVTPTPTPSPSAAPETTIQCRRILFWRFCRGVSRRPSLFQ